MAADGGDPFNRFLDEAIASIPEPFASRLGSVAIVVEDWPTPDQLASVQARGLYGLYQGVPRTAFGVDNVQMPSKITIFRGPLEKHHRDRAELREVGVHLELAVERSEHPPVLHRDDDQRPVGEPAKAGRHRGSHDMRAVGHARESMVPDPRERVGARGRGGAALLVAPPVGRRTADDLSARVSFVGLEAGSPESRVAGPQSGVASRRSRIRHD